MRAQTILFLLLDRVRGKLDCRPYRGRGEGNPKRLVEGGIRAFSCRSSFLTLRDSNFIVFNHEPDIRFAVALLMEPCLAVVELGVLHLDAIPVGRFSLS